MENTPLADSNPINTRKQRKTARMKETIWLLVKELANRPMATYEPAKNNSPIYEPQVPPESRFPGVLPN